MLALLLLNGFEDYLILAIVILFAHLPLVLGMPSVLKQAKGGKVTEIDDFGRKVTKEIQKIPFWKVNDFKKVMGIQAIAYILLFFAVKYIIS